MPRRRQLVILAIVAAIALGLFLGVPVLKALLTPKPPPPAAAPPPGTFVATAEEMATLKFAAVKAMAFHAADETDGKIATNDEHTTQVFSPYSGRVTKIFANPGDAVKAGAPLFAVNASEFVQGQSDLITATAQVRLTAAAAERQHALFKANGAAQKDVQQSDLDYANAQAALLAAKNRLKILGLNDEQIDGLQARPLSKGMAPDTVVVSPVAGVVTQKSIGLGQNIASISLNGGGAPAMTVSNLSTVWLVGNLREDDAPKARLGQKVQVHVPALADQVFTGRVGYVAPTVDPVSRRVIVRAEIPNPGGVLKPEMFANFVLLTGADTERVGVPAEAVVFEGDKARVWVVAGHNTLALREIRAGRTQGGMIEALSGLAAGETVVTSGSLFIDRAAQGD
jgi:cobalt-zinc-cadmium efflux system membrane fusion protein